MRYVRRFLTKCIGLFRNRRLDAELDWEIKAHLALLEDDFRQRGMSIDEARVAARRAYGNVERARQMHREERMIARLTILFGVLALVLTSVGLYGITAYQAMQRTREIGLRMAFGADRTRVVGMVMRGAFVQFILG